MIFQIVPQIIMFRTAYKRLRKSYFYRQPLRWQLSLQSRHYLADFAHVQSYALFIGHGRSSHSLVAALLNAHPNVVMADELDSLSYVAEGISRSQLYTLIIQSAAHHAKKGNRKGDWRGRGYSYQIAGQWQGNYEQLRIIGEASLATAYFHNNLPLFEKLVGVVQVPVKAIQVVRNPYDSITRLSKVSQISLDLATEHYFWVCERVKQFRKWFPAGNTILIHNEELIANPQTTLQRLTTFFDLPLPPDYTAACTAILFKKPNQARHEASWSPEAIANVAKCIPHYNFLAGYSYDGQD